MHVSMLTFIKGWMDGWILGMDILVGRQVRFGR